MLVFVLAMAMVAGLVSATAVTIHNDAEKARVKAVIRKHRILN